MKNPNWQKELANVIEKAQEVPFFWGKHDCCLFASNCALAVTGKDPSEKYRGRYTSEIGAKRVLAKEHGSIESAFDAYFERVDPALAQRGDIVLFDSEMGKTAGVMWSSHIWSVGLCGVAIVKNPKPYMAWRVE